MTAKNRFVTMAQDYDVMAPIMVPQYNFLQSTIIEYLEIANSPQPIVVDLGAGSGIFLERILAANDTALAYWVDSSEGFLALAQQRLRPYADRVTFITSTMEDAWEQQLAQTPTCIFSMSAIHHLEHAEKRALYRRCFETLAGGGWLVNIDEMKTMNDDAYYQSLLYWARHVDQSTATLPAAQQALGAQWNEHFDRWKARNIDGFDRPKVKGDDLHETFIRQMTWLSEIGFVRVDLFVKYHLWCVVGGQKPAAQ